MRWRIRTQLLFPLLTLLLGVVGVSAWTAVASARRAWGQTEDQFRRVAQVLAEAYYPLTAGVLRQMKGLSGAEYVLLTADGERIATFDAPNLELPPEAVVEEWPQLRVG